MARPNRTGARVAIIGAGVNGCSIAFHLARMGAGVTVLDKGGICAGMTARSGAMVRMHYTFAPEADLAWKSLGYFQNWKDIVGGECGFVRTGFALVVDEENAERMRKNVAMLKTVGVEIEILGPRQLKQLDPEARTDDIALAAYEPQSGYADPALATRSLADGARSCGAEFELARAVAIEVAHGRVAGVITEAGTIAADAVCVAAGPWTDGLLSPLGVRIGIRAERAQIAFFRRSAELRHLAYIDLAAGIYFRPYGANLTLAGLGELSHGAEQDPDNFRADNDASFIGAVSERLRRRIPRMAGAPYLRGHAGIYDVSPDSRAVLGAIPEVAGLFVAAGFSGTGFKTAPAVGAAMAELILGGRGTAADLTPFSFARLREGRPIRGANEYTMGAGFGHTV